MAENVDADLNGDGKVSPEELIGAGEAVEKAERAVQSAGLSGWQTFLGGSVPQLVSTFDKYQKNQALNRARALLSDAEKEAGISYEQLMAANGVDVSAEGDSGEGGGSEAGYEPDTSLAANRLSTRAGTDGAPIAPLGFESLAESGRLSVVETKLPDGSVDYKAVITAEPGSPANVERQGYEAGEPANRSVSTGGSAPVVRHLNYFPGDEMQYLTTVMAQENGLQNLRDMLFISGYFGTGKEAFPPTAASATPRDLEALTLAMTDANINSGMKLEDLLEVRSLENKPWGYPASDQEKFEAGQAAQSMDKLLEDYGRKNGVVLSPNYVGMMANQVNRGVKSVDEVLADVRNNHAAKLYPQFAENLANGETLEDAVAPFAAIVGDRLGYVGRAAPIDDPIMKRVLSFQDSSGNPAVPRAGQLDGIIRTSPEWLSSKAGKRDKLAQLRSFARM